MATAISNQTMKELQLNILEDVIQFCEENKIRYFLSGGSMLGAIRHGGFIPWDDDIDLCMPRPDYLRFLTEYRHERFKVYAWELDSDFRCTYAKVADLKTILEENADFNKEIGINIDIFPVDGLPEKAKNRKWFVSYMIFLNRLASFLILKDLSKRGFLKSAIIAAVQQTMKMLKVERKLIGHVIKKAQTYSFAQASYVGVVVWGYGLKEIFRKETMTTYLTVPFEHYQVTILEEYETYLSQIYGDYMTLPPEEEQTATHQSQARWKEE
ncbi:LicD family protein [Streptococcus marmotae]|uniref:LicD family protein n=1 Tax=Streptococcus marmotae TaxID=1825069 RepID=UPI000829E757|nr:LicD family protein [Streptococcus marmotae]